MEKQNQPCKTHLQMKTKINQIQIKIQIQMQMQIQIKIKIKIKKIKTKIIIINQPMKNRLKILLWKVQQHIIQQQKALKLAQHLKM